MPTPPRMPTTALGVVICAFPAWLIWPPTKRMTPFDSVAASLPVFEAGS